MTLTQAVIKTLTYSDHFGFPLTGSEIFARLIKHRVREREHLFRALQKLVDSRVITKTGKYYHLPGRSSLVARRRSRARSSQPLLTQARALASRLAHLPGVLAVYLTGSLAVQNSGNNADIDLMVITRDYKLWTTRLLLTLYTSLLGLRRTPGSHQNSGKLCLNLYLTPSSFSLPTSRQNLYTAYELVQAIPLHDPYNTHDHLLSANSWLTTYLPNFSFPQSSNSPIFNIQYSIFSNYLESLLYHLQLLYMRPKITREYVTPGSAFFHPHDPGKVILSKLLDTQ